MWRLHNILLQNDWIKEEIKGEIKRYRETNENDNMTHQDFWDAAKAVTREKFVSLQVYLRKPEKYEVNNLTLHHKELQKEEQKQPKFHRRKEIIKIGAELSEMEKKKTVQKKINTNKLVLWKD